MKNIHNMGWSVGYVILKNYFWVSFFSLVIFSITKGLRKKTLFLFIFWQLVLIFYPSYKFFKRILLKIEITQSGVMVLTFAKYLRIHKYNYYLNNCNIEFSRTIRARGVYGDTVKIISNDYICKIEVPLDGWEKSTFLEINEMCKDAQV